MSIICWDEPNVIHSRACAKRGNGGRNQRKESTRDESVEEGKYCHASDAFDAEERPHYSTGQETTGKEDYSKDESLYVVDVEPLTVQGSISVGKKVRHHPSGHCAGVENRNLANHS